MFAATHFRTSRSVCVLVHRCEWGDLIMRLVDESGLVDRVFGPVPKTHSHSRFPPGRARCEVPGYPSLGFDKCSNREDRALARSNTLLKA